MNNHLLSQFFNVDEEQLLAAAESFAASGPQIWPASNPVYVKMEDSGDDASSNASWGFTATSTTPMDYDDAPATINCIPGGLAQISLPGSSRSPSPDMTLPGGFNFSAASQQQQQKPVSAIPAHLRPREAALSPSSLVSPLVVPTLLQQQQPSPTQASKSNGRKLNPTTSASPPSPSSPAPENNNGQPHPYSISATNTTALFTRASSVSSTTSGPTKKGRAPPSGPISTKDFVPPDVSGLSKREARLVKNRAAAFLSRQRKREEFEGLEARVEVLETDNARLYKELEAYRSGSSSATPAAAAAPALAPSGATPAALQAELVGLRRQLGARDQELAKLHSRMQAINAEANAERERVAQKDAEIAQLKRQLAARGGAPAASKEEDSDSDSEDAQSTTDGMVVSGKKDLKSAGSMAFMVLLFSLSSLLTSAESSGSAKPPVASERVRRPGMHHRDSSRTYLDLPQQAFSSGLAYDSFLSTSDSSMMLSPSFGFDEDSLLGGSSAFVGLSSSASPTQPPRQQQKKVQDNHVADSLASAISGVKCISSEEFEFDFTVPSTSSSSLDSFAFPARPKQDQAGKKIRVCVKSALPLNLNVDALSKAASTSSSAPAASQKVNENDLFASTLGYRVPATDDLLGDSGFWNAAASTFGGSVSPSSVLSPTMSTASSESRKRKRVVVEINPRGGSRRRLSEDDDGDDEMDTWDVKFSEDDFVGASDEDVQMRL